eukprot:scaffold71937_cov53-Phaeocystis_antarctica.AAC.1
MTTHNYSGCGAACSRSLLSPSVLSRFPPARAFRFAQKGARGPALELCTRGPTCDAHRLQVLTSGSGSSELRRRPLSSSPDPGIRGQGACSGVSTGP